MEGGWFKNVRVLLVLNEEEIQAEIGGHAASKCK